MGGCPFFLKVDVSLSRGVADLLPGTAVAVGAKLKGEADRGA